MPSLFRNEQLKAENGWIAANETWTYNSADTPTFTFLISGDKTGKYSAGMRLKLTQTSVKYFLITNVVYSSPNTVVTVYGGPYYSLTGAAITVPFYSMVKAPQGFPLSPTNWTFPAYLGGGLQANPVAGTWYNLGSASIDIPIGIWRVYMQAVFQGYDAGSSTGDNFLSLSTSSSSESDSEATINFFIQGGTAYAKTTIFREVPVVLTAKTTFYVIAKTSTANVDQISDTAIVIKCVSSYL